ncbi:hypothetical protein [Streptomyces mirabilis]
MADNAIDQVRDGGLVIPGVEACRTLIRTPRRISDLQQNVPQFGRTHIPSRHTDVAQFYQCQRAFEIPAVGVEVVVGHSNGLGLTYLRTR